MTTKIDVEMILVELVGIGTEHGHEVATGGIVLKVDDGLVLL